MVQYGVEPCVRKSKRLALQIGDGELEVLPEEAGRAMVASVRSISVIGIETVLFAMGPDKEEWEVL